MNEPKNIESGGIRTGRSYAQIVICAQKIKEGQFVKIFQCKDPKEKLKQFKKLGVIAEFETRKDVTIFKLKG